MTQPTFGTAMQPPIKTEHVFPPIPMRQFDWTAYRDPEPGCLVGRGPTEEAAIADLLEQEAEEQDDGEPFVNGPDTSF